MELEGSLPSSQNFATGFCPKLDESIPHRHILFLSDQF
jgi:hypothetical protein